MPLWGDLYILWRVKGYGRGGYARLLPPAEALAREIAGVAVHLQPAAGRDHVRQRASLLRQRALPRKHRLANHLG